MNTLIKVFIQNKAGSLLKNKHDEKTFEHLGSTRLKEPYPHAYGFIPGTKASDGDCVDCYVFTDTELERDTIVECSPIGLLELYENDQPDHKVIATIPGETSINVDDALEVLKEFIGRASIQFPNIVFVVGNFLPSQTVFDHIGGLPVGSGPIT
jgi:inorganic pyrophosphatase